MTARKNAGPPSPSSKSRIWKAAVVIAIAAFLIVIVVLKTEQSPNAQATGRGGSPTAERTDAVRAFEQAQAAGKPIYLLFHSLTCDPCVEISANVDQVIPDYAGKITFVNAVTDDASTQQLAARFNFQYIPTSFFIGRDGQVIDSYTGVLSPAELRARLDRLAAS